jgi:hypothetical protein
MAIARNEADVIITNPPFSKFEHFYNAMLSTKKDVICFGNGAAVQYTWTKKLWNNKKLSVIPFEFNEFLTPTYKRKRAKTYVFTNIYQSHTTDKIKPLEEISKQYFDENGILVVDNFVPSDYYKPFSISVSPIKNGILNSGYKLLQCSYRPVVDNKYKFKRTIIVKELNAKGKPNIEFDNLKFEEAKIIKTEKGILFDK